MVWPERKGKGAQTTQILPSDHRRIYKIHDGMDGKQLEGVAQEACEGIPRSGRPPEVTVPSIPGGVQEHSLGKENQPQTLLSVI